MRLRKKLAALKSEAAKLSMGDIIDSTDREWHCGYVDPSVVAAAAGQAGFTVLSDEMLHKVARIRCPARITAAQIQATTANSAKRRKVGCAQSVVCW